MKTFLTAALAISLAGCATLSAQPDPSRFFTLSSLSPDEQSTGARVQGISLGIGPVTLPGYLDRQEIVTRIAQNQIRLSEHDRWAEPLDEGVARVLSQNLASLLRAERITSYPWPIDRRPVYHVEIELLRFETDSGQEAHLAARWTLRHMGKKDTVRYRETHLTRTAKTRTTAASVAALSEALAGLSREIAEAVETMDGTGK